MLKRRKFSIDTIINISMGAILLLGGFAIGNLTTTPQTVEIIQEVEKVIPAEPEIQYVEVPTVVTVHDVQKVDRVPETELTQGEKELIAKVVMAEAAYEDMIGKRLVVDTVLNRVGRPGFGDSVYAVVYAPNQYYHAAIYTEDCMQAVEMECMERLDRRVAWFCNNGWMPYGEHAYQHGGHWFSWFSEDVPPMGAGAQEVIE